MKLPRRKFLNLAAAAGALPMVSRFAFAQAIRRGRCASLSDLPPLGAPTSWRA
jgi:hypothetical protein